MSGGTKLTPGLCLSRRVFGAISAISVPPDTHCCCSTSAPPGPSLFPELLIYCTTPFEGSGAHSRNIRATPLNIVPAILLQCTVDCPRRGHPVKTNCHSFTFLNSSSSNTSLRFTIAVFLGNHHHRGDFQRWFRRRRRRSC